MSEYAVHGEYHPSTFQRRFKTWFKALDRAGLQPARSEINIPEQKLFQNLAEVWIKLGRQPRYNEMRLPLSKYSSGTYEHRYGTWRKALEAFVDNANKDTNIVEAKPAMPEASDSGPILNRKTIKTSREISLRQRFAVFVRDGFRCQACGRGPITHPGIELHVDHIIPWSEGGTTTLDNLRTLCSDDNLGKGNMLENDSWK